MEPRLPCRSRPAKIIHPLLKEYPMSPRYLAAFMSATALVAFSFPAAAIEPQAAAQALATALTGGSNAKVTFDGATQAGANIVIQGLSVADTQGDGTVRFNETVIESPTDGGAGVFDSPRISFKRRHRDRRIDRLHWGRSADASDCA
jgi:hypothetical protein